MSLAVKCGGVKTMYTISTGRIVEDLFTPWLMKHISRRRKYVKKHR